MATSRTISNREHSFDFELAEIVGIEKAILLKNINYWCLENQRRKITSQYINGIWWTSESLNSLADKYKYMKRGNLSRWLHQLNEDRWILLHAGEKGNNFYAPGPVFDAWNTGEDWQQVFQNEIARCFKMKQCVFQNETVGVSKRNNGVFQNEIAITNVETNVEEKDIEKNNPPQAAVTTFAPDQIDQTAVTLVAHEVFALEAEKNEDHSGGADFSTVPVGPLKEIPASQDAGAFEANPVPPNFSTSKPNPRKQPARPGPETEITDPAILEFYHAIAADWAEWVDYKRREKKGNYKTAKTETVAIGGLYRKVSGSPDKAREAIQHSIENTYSGIFPPKTYDTKPSAPRYSPEDRPVNPVTGNDLLAEISQFYRANTGLWCETLQGSNAATWTPVKQKQAAEKFCLHQVSTGRATDTFAQLNARLQAWFTKENSIQAASIAGAPSAVHQAPARVSAPVRYQETE